MTEVKILENVLLYERNIWCMVTKNYNHLQLNHKILYVFTVCF